MAMRSHRIETHGDSEIMDTIKIDYHLSHYRAACHQLSVGIASPRESARLEAIRDASLCAIALEANIISEIGNGELPRGEWGKTISWIKQYQPADQEFFQLPPLQVVRVVYH